LVNAESTSLMWRAFRKSQREIARYSKPKQHTIFDAIQSGAFVVAFFIAPFIVWNAQRMYTQVESEVLLHVRVFLSPENERTEYGGLTGFAIADKDLKLGWIGVTPMAQVIVVDETVRHGWPLTTVDFTPTTVLRSTLIPPCQESMRADVDSVAREVALKAGVFTEYSRTRVHYGSWIFSVGAWWFMISALVALLLLPARFIAVVRKRARNAIRQNRMNTSRCPNCGYNVRSTMILGRCPECGSSVYERPEY
jgi:hypothetical protein